MDKIFINLKENPILKNSNIKSLEEYINLKYPEYTDEKKSNIFNDALKRYFDKHLNNFSEDTRKNVLDTILVNSILKKNFNVTAYDLFKVLLSLNINNEIYIKDLYIWINSHQEIPLSLEYFNDFISYVVNLESFDIETDLLKLYSQYTTEKIFIHKINNPKVIHNPKRKARLNLKKIHIFSPIMVLAVFFIFNLLFIRKLNSVIQPDDYNINSLVTYYIEIEEKTTPVFNDWGYLEKNNLDTNFRYKLINKSKLKQFLSSKNSILAEEPYFSTIIDTSKNYDINPLLLFSITGQEQGYVPKDSENAKKIANNPYNVFGSWQKYNKDILDSTKIVSRTVITLSQDKPSNYNTFKWINKQYAEDQTWWEGVSYCFSELLEATN